MRLLPLMLLGLPLAMACGSFGTDSTPSYNVAATNQGETGMAGQNRVVTFTLTVTDDNGQIVANNPIILQLSVGAAVPNLPVTIASGPTAGQASVIWTILVADQVAGHLEALAFCAPGAGESFCKTNLNGSKRVTVQF